MTQPRKTYDLDLVTPGYHQAILSIAYIVLILMASLLCGRRSYAAGFYLPWNSLADMARGGTLVSGDTGIDAIVINPSAIGGALDQWTLDVDFGFLIPNHSYERIDSGGNPLPRVYGVSKNILSFGAAHIGIAGPLIRDRIWTAISIMVPTGYAQAFPRPNYQDCAAGQERDCLDGVPYDAPQRYSLISTDATFSARFSMSAIIKIVERQFLGISLRNSYVGVSILKAIGTQDAALSAGPEDPSFDALVHVHTRSFFNPSARLSYHGIFFDRLHIGFSGETLLPARLTGTVRVQTPVSPLYDAAYAEGDRVSIRFTLPWQFALGASYHFNRYLAAHVALGYELWSGLTNFAITPNNIALRNVPIADKFPIGSLSETLNLQDTWSARTGLSWNLPWYHDLKLDLGYAFEQGAPAPLSHSILLADSDKHTLGIGFQFSVAKTTQLRLAYGTVLFNTVTVPYDQSTSQQINPLNQADAVFVGGGTYQKTLHVFGIHIRQSL